jgi:hypothetical protein
VEDETIAERPPERNLIGAQHIQQATLAGMATLAPSRNAGSSDPRRTRNCSSTSRTIQRP